MEGCADVVSPVNISASPQDGLDARAPDVAQSRAASGMREVRQAWADRLSQDPDALFAELLTFPQQELISLLAVCVALTVGAVSSREGDTPAALLAQAVRLNMHDWVDPRRCGLLRARVRGQDAGSGAGVRAGAGQTAGQAQEGRTCQRGRTAGGRNEVAAGDVQGRGRTRH